MMLTKAVAPRTKAELIAALSKASFRLIDVYEGDQLASLPSLADLKRYHASVIVVRT